MKMSPQNVPRRATIKYTQPVYFLPATPQHCVSIVKKGGYSTASAVATAGSLVKAQSALLVVG